MAFLLCAIGIRPIFLQAILPREFGSPANPPAARLRQARRRQVRLAPFVLLPDQELPAHNRPGGFASVARPCLRPCAERYADSSRADQRNPPAPRPNSNSANRVRRRRGCRADLRPDKHPRGWWSHNHPSGRRPDQNRGCRSRSRARLAGTCGWRVCWRLRRRSHRHRGKCYRSLRLASVSFLRRMLPALSRRVVPLRWARRKNGGRVGASGRCLCRSLRPRRRTHADGLRNPVRWIRRWRFCLGARYRKHRGRRAAPASPVRRAGLGRPERRANRVSSYLRALAIPIRSRRLAFRGAQAAQRSVQFHQLLLRQSFGTFQNFARAIVGLAHFALFIVGQGHDTQRQYFVDFGAIEQIARAFGGDLGIVVENNRRREHGVALALVAYEHRPSTDVLTQLSEFAIGIGRINQGNKFSGASFQDGVCGNQRSRECFFTARRAPTLEARSVCNPRAEREHAILQPLRREFDHSYDAGFVAQDYSTHQSLVIANSFSFLLG